MKTRLLTEFYPHHISARFYQNVLEKCYNTSATMQECYHNYHHIDGMFCHAAELGWLLSAAEELAILFHDSVYVPGSKMNEQISVGRMYDYVGASYRDGNATCFAQLFTKDMPGWVERTLTKASVIILDTISHFPTSPESNCVLDLDLYEIGTKDFNRNSSLIYNEFHSMLMVKYEGDEAEARKQFAIGRGNWAEEFLNRPRIYHTVECEHMEIPARENLQKLVDEGNKLK